MRSSTLQLLQQEIEWLGVLKWQSGREESLSILNFCATEGEAAHRRFYTALRARDPKTIARSYYHCSCRLSVVSSCLSCTCFMFTVGCGN